MSDTTAVDLLVLGCGPAGEKAAVQAAYFGKRVAVVERGPLGGACVHTGTLPSKGLRESALAMQNLQRLGLRGVQVSLAEDVRVDELLAHKEQVVAAETERIRRNLAEHGVALWTGTAAFVDLHTVCVQASDGQQQRLTAHVIVIATGTRPHRPADIAFDQELIWDSDEVVSMSSIPRSLVVYGAGVIGCEYASMFAALGVKVWLLEPREAILPFVDHDVARKLLDAFRTRGVEVWTQARYTRMEVEGNTVVTHLADGRTLRSDRALYAAGRTGNTAELDLATIGLVPTSRGLLEVNEHYQTQVPHIYAVGDVIGFPALASTSMDQGRVAVCHAFGFDYKTRLGALLPYGIYTIPECSMVGASEQELRQGGRPCEIGVAGYGANARAQLVGDPDGLLKLVFDPKDRRLLGVHIVGQRASELVHVGMAVMQLGGTIDVFIDAVFNYPTLGELYKYAAYDGLGRLGKRQGASST